MASLGISSSFFYFKRWSGWPTLATRWQRSVRVERRWSSPSIRWFNLSDRLISVGHFQLFLTQRAKDNSSIRFFPSHSLSTILCPFHSPSDRFTTGRQLVFPSIYRQVLVEPTPLFYQSWMKNKRNRTFISFFLSLLLLLAADVQQPHGRSPLFVLYIT